MTLANEDANPILGDYVEVNVVHSVVKRLSDARRGSLTCCVGMLCALRRVCVTQRDLFLNC